VRKLTATPKKYPRHGLKAEVRTGRVVRKSSF
jgi:hypothetical protein